MKKNILLKLSLILISFPISAMDAERQVEECFSFSSVVPPIPKKICHHILSFTSASDYFSIREVNRGFDAMIREVDDDIYALQKTYQDLHIRDFLVDENESAHETLREILEYSTAILKIKESLLPFEKKRLKQDKNDFRELVFKTIANHPLMVTYCIKRHPFPSCQQDLLLEHIKKFPNFDAKDLKKIRKPLAFLSVLVANKLRDRHKSPIHRLISSLDIPPLNYNEEPAFQLLYPEGVKSILDDGRYKKIKKNSSRQLHFVRTFIAIGDFFSASVFFRQYIAETKTQDDLENNLKAAYLLKKAYQYEEGLKYYEKAFQIAANTKSTIDPKDYIRAGLCCYELVEVFYPAEGGYNQSITKQGIGYFETALQRGATLTAPILDKFKEMKEDFLSSDDEFHS